MITVVPGGALAADRRESALADVPEPRGFDGVGGEIHAIERRRGVDGCGDRREFCAQIVGIGGARLDQQRRGVWPERIDSTGMPFLS